MFYCRFCVKKCDTEKKQQHFFHSSAVLVFLFQSFKYVFFIQYFVQYLICSSFFFNVFPVSFRFLLINGHHNFSSVETYMQFPNSPHLCITRRMCSTNYKYSKIILLFSSLPLQAESRNKRFYNVCSCSSLREMKFDQSCSGWHILIHQNCFKKRFKTSNSLNRLS